MKDPFVALQDALHPVFHLEPMRKHRFVYPEIQQLANALERFNLNDNKRNFILLLKTIRAALPRIEKWHIDFNTIKVPMDYLGKELNMPIINWDRYLAHSNTSLRFQFSALHRKHADPDLLPWLTAKTGTIIALNTPVDVLTRVLIECTEHFGFTQKLGAHLKNDPDFLFRIIMASEKHFIEIIQTRLVLYLTDQQLAQAIIKHEAALVTQEKNILIQSTKLIAKLNEHLSYGLSVSTLLRNTEARFILESSKLFEIYQDTMRGSAALTESKDPPSSLEEGGLETTPVNLVNPKI